MKHYLTIFLTLLLLTFTGSSHAQDDSSITLDSPVTVSVTADHPAHLTYQGQSGEIITIITRSLEDSFDPVLDVWLPDDTQYAYSDDSGLITGGDASIVDRNARLENLILPETGLYTILVDSFNGVSEGDVEVTVSAGDPFQAHRENTDDTLIYTAYLPKGLPFRAVFEAEANSHITITVRDLSGTLDTLVMLLEADDSLLAENDDHGTANLTLNTLDSQISDFVISETGTYSIMVRDFLGRTGRFELTVYYK